MSIAPNETEQALNRQYDVYAAAREEYRKKIDEQAARIERLEKALRRIADTDPDEGTQWFHDVASAALEERT